MDESQLNYIKTQCRGILVNFDSQIDIWETLLEKSVNLPKDRLQAYDKSLSLTLSVAPFAPAKVRERTLEIVFEYFHFGAFHPLTS